MGQAQLTAETREGLYTGCARAIWPCVYVVASSLIVDALFTYVSLCTYPSRKCTQQLTTTTTTTTATAATTVDAASHQHLSLRPPPTSINSPRHSQTANRVPRHARIRTSTRVEGPLNTN
jgi:hypothetical protein